MAYKPSAPYLYLPDGWDTGWKTAKTTRAWLTLWGDSISTGNNSTDPMTTMWFALLRSHLLQSYAEYATLWGPGMNVLNVGVTSPTTPYPWVITTNTSGNVAPFGSTCYGAGFRADPSDVLTYNTEACTAIDIIYTGGYGGTWTYAIDGGAAVTVTNANANPLYRISITGLTKVAHSVVFSGATAPAGILIAAVIAYPNGSTANGLGLANLALGGQQSINYNNNNVSWAVLGAPSQSYAASGFGYPAGADLNILALGINDCVNGNVTPTIYEWLWGKQIQLMRRAKPGCSIILLIPCNATQWSDAPSQFGGSEFWSMYKAAMYRLASAWNCAVVDVDAKWGSTPYAQGFVSTNQSHPTNAGQTDIATLFEEIV